MEILEKEELRKKNIEELIAKIKKYREEYGLPPLKDKMIHSYAARALNVLNSPQILDIITKPNLSIGEMEKITGLRYGTIAQYRMCLRNVGVLNSKKKKLEELKAKIREINPLLKEERIEELANFAYYALKPKYYPILTDPDLSIKDMARKTGLTENTIKIYRSGLISIGEGKKPRVRKPKDLVQARPKKHWIEDLYLKKLADIGPCTAMELAREMGYTSRTILIHLKKLEDCGKVKRVEFSTTRGKYGISMLFGGYLKNRPIFYIPESQTHREKLSSILITGIEKGWKNYGEVGFKRALAFQLAEANLPKDVYSKVKEYLLGLNSSPSGSLVEEIILESVKKMGYCFRKDLDAETNLSSRYINYRLKKLVEEGKLKRSKTLSGMKYVYFLPENLEPLVRILNDEPKKKLPEDVYEALKKYMKR
ncbi:MAG: hypothetical protein QXL86_00450 [Candidatus Aenigmatarchaeota archaeon]